MKKLYLSIITVLFFTIATGVSAQNISNITVTPTGGGVGGSGTGALGTDFTSVPITVEQGENLTVTFTLTHGANNIERAFMVVKAGWPATSDNVNAAYNNIFAYPGEASPYTETNANYAIPIDATIGDHSLRINGKNWTSPTASGWGNVADDIKITVVAAGTLSTKNKNAFEFKAFPNPVKDVLRINTLEAISKVEVFDLLGKSVLTQYNVMDQVDVSGLKKSIYLVKLTSNKGVSTKKFVKE